MKSAISHYIISQYLYKCLYPVEQKVLRGTHCVMQNAKACISGEHCLAIETLH